MAFPLRVGVLLLPEAPWAEMARRWRSAEELVFSNAWTHDHLRWGGHRDKPWYGVVPVLAAAAAATSTMRLGPLVASANFRHPLLLAKELITLDDISGGRVTAGLGAGGTGWDATMLGDDAWSRRERADRFQEFIKVTDRLLSDTAATVRGHYYSVAEARTYPGCVQQPRIPLAIAASGPRGMGLAALYGQTWVTTGLRAKVGPVSAAEGAKDVRAQMDRLDQQCARADRDPVSLDRLVLTGPVLDAGLGAPEAFAETAGPVCGGGRHRSRRPLAPLRRAVCGRPTRLRADLLVAEV